jgi:uncharacterized membrane protein YfcA
VVWIALPLAVLIGVSLGLLGGGGAILATPMLAYVVGLDAKEAIASSLLVVGATSALGAAIHARNVDLRVGATFGVAGAAGAFLGGRAAGHVPASALMLAFGGIMMFTGVAMLRARRVSGGDGGLHVAKALVAGAGVGFVSGLVGAGGGFLVVPALVLYGGMPTLRAISTSLFVIALQSFAAFVGHASHVHVRTSIVGPVIAAALVGAVGGALLARRIAPETLRRWFGVLVLATACVVLVKELGGGHT